MIPTVKGLYSLVRHTAILIIASRRSIAEINSAVSCETFDKNLHKGKSRLIEVKVAINAHNLVLYTPDRLLPRYAFEENASVLKVKVSKRSKRITVEHEIHRKNTGIRRQWSASRMPETLRTFRLLILRLIWTNNHQFSKTKI